MQRLAGIRVRIHSSLDVEIGCYLFIGETSSVFLVKQSQSSFLGKDAHRVLGEVSPDPRWIGKALS